MELHEMTIAQLRELRQKAETEIKLKEQNGNFVKEANLQVELENRQRVERMELREQSPKLKELREIGYTTVVHDENRFSILDYSKGENKFGQYYGVEYKNGEMFKTANNVKDEDYEKVTAIIMQEKIKVKG